MKLLSLLVLLAFQEGRQLDNVRAVVEETGRMKESKNPSWWVNSGAYFIQRPGYAETVQGKLEQDNKWRLLYNKNNPRDTDNGFHPQNIFRLVNQHRYENIQQEVYFQITALNMSESENRNESNGVLLFNRYQDGDNLYYTGLRVDGHAVIKKKIGGTYYTLAYPAALYSGKYDRLNSPNLLPSKKWIGIRSVLETVDQAVTISFYVDPEANGVWQLAAQATDKGENGLPLGSGFAGLRTDFMDVRFTAYKATSF